MFVNIYAHNIGTPKYIRQILTDLKEEIKESNTIVVGDLSMDRSLRQKINKGNISYNQNIRPKRLNRYMQNIPTKNNRIHIFLSLYGTFSG